MFQTPALDYFFRTGRQGPTFPSQETWNVYPTFFLRPLYGEIPPCDCILGHASKSFLFVFIGFGEFRLFPGHRSWSQHFSLLPQEFRLVFLYFVFPFGAPPGTFMFPTLPCRCYEFRQALPENLYRVSSRFLSLCAPTLIPRSRSIRSPKTRISFRRAYSLPWLSRVSQPSKKAAFGSARFFRALLSLYVLVVLRPIFLPVIGSNERETFLGDGGFPLPPLIFLSLGLGELLAS